MASKETSPIGKTERSAPLQDTPLQEVSPGVSVPGNVGAGKTNDQRMIVSGKEANSDHIPMTYVENRLYSNQFDINQPVGTILYETLLGPQNFKGTHFEFLSRIFLWWAANIHFRFTMPTTAFHSGRLMFVYVPNVTEQLKDKDLLYISQFPHKIYDIRLQNEMLFPIEWTNPELKLATRPPPGANDYQSLKSQYFGRFYILIETPIRSTGETSETLNFTVWMKPSNVKFDRIAGIYNPSVDLNNNDIGESVYGSAASPNYAPTTTTAVYNSDKKLFRTRNTRQIVREENQQPIIPLSLQSVILIPKEKFLYIYAYFFTQLFNCPISRQIDGKTVGSVSTFRTVQDLFGWMSTICCFGVTSEATLTFDDTANAVIFKTAPGSVPSSDDFNIVQTRGGYTTGTAVLFSSVNADGSTSMSGLGNGVAVGWQFSTNRGESWGTVRFVYSPAVYAAQFSDTSPVGLAFADSGTGGKAGYVNAFFGLNPGDNEVKYDDQKKTFTPYNEIATDPNFTDPNYTHVPVYSALPSATVESTLKPVLEKIMADQPLTRDDSLVAMNSFLSLNLNSTVGIVNQGRVYPNDQTTLSFLSWLWKGVSNIGTIWSGVKVIANGVATVISAFTQVGSLVQLDITPTGTPITLVPTPAPLSAQEKDFASDNFDKLVSEQRNKDLLVVLAKSKIKEDVPENRYFGVKSTSRNGFLCIDLY